MPSDEEKDEEALMWALVEALNNMRDCLASLSLDLKDLQFEMQEKDSLDKEFDAKKFFSKY